MVIRYSASATRLAARSALGIVLAAVSQPAFAQDNDGDYWAATKDYWAAVRAGWDRVAATRGGIAIQEEAETGTVISGSLLDMANEIQDQKLTTDKAIAEAKKLIEANTKKI